jgi:hypothetical protein
MTKLLISLWFRILLLANTRHVTYANNVKIFINWKNNLTYITSKYPLKLKILNYILCKTVWTNLKNPNNCEVIIWWLVINAELRETQIKLCKFVRRIKYLLFVYKDFLMDRKTIGKLKFHIKLCSKMKFINFMELVCILVD